jgi:hypothetical protein
MLFLAAALAWGASDAPRQYAALAPIEATSSEGLQRVELPLAALQAAKGARLEDVRVFDREGQPVPIAWAEAQPRASIERTLDVPRFAWPQPGAALSRDAPPLRVEVNAAGAVVRIEQPGATAAPSSPVPRLWLLDLSALADREERLQRIVLDWPRREAGLATTVRVEASDDAAHWSSATRAELLELPASAAGAPALTHIDWPAGRATPKYLRLAFDVPLALSRSTLVLVRHGAAPPLQSMRASFAPVAAEGEQPAHWLLDLQGRVELRSLRLELAPPNTLLGLRLEQRFANGEPWRSVTRFVAWRLVRDGHDARSSEVPIDAAPARYWRLVPDSRGAAPQPTEPLAATLEWRAPQLVFVARGSGGWQFAVGREKDAATALPLTTLLPDFRPGDEFRLPLARLGALVAQRPAVQGFAQSLAEASAEDRRRWALWAVLGLAVAGLGVLAWRLARDLRQPPA